MIVIPSSLRTSVLPSLIKRILVKSNYSEIRGNLLLKNIRIHAYRVKNLKQLLEILFEKPFQLF